MTRRCIVTVLIIIRDDIRLLSESDRAVHPDGRSPDCRVEVTMIGDITGVYAQGKLLKCTDSTGSVIVKILPTTRIWIDRSKKMAQNAAGSHMDCIAGRRIEIKFAHNERKDSSTADWIKIEQP
jgi:hypothetical protein